jgi:hypothetical protein
MGEMVVVKTSYRHITDQQEHYAVIGEKAYRWRWLARLLNPIGTHFYRAAIGPLFIKYEIEDKQAGSRLSTSD